MAGINDTTEKNISEIALVERATKGKQYPAGAILIKLSSSDDSVEMMDAPGIVDTRYAVIVSKKLPPEYLKIAIENVYPEFYSRFNQCINMAFSDLLRLSVKIHNDLEMQTAVCQTVKEIEAILKAEQIEIENLKFCKKFFLDKMMAREDLDDGDESGQ